MRKILGMIILLIGSIIWGFAFVAQKDATNYIGTFTLNGIRFLIGAIVLLPVILIKNKKSSNVEKDIKINNEKFNIKAGIICGVFLFVAANLQQFGISLYPSHVNVSGRTGFITALYVIVVPIITIFLKKKIGINVIVSALLASVGLYFLCFSGGLDAVYLGDFVTLLCAIAFAVQIICIDIYSSKVDGVKLAFYEFLSCGTLSLISMFIFEKIDINLILQAWLSILYLGVLSSGVGYTLHIIGQQYSNNPTLDSIIMSLESVFALLGGVIVFQDKFTTNEIIGCIIMFVSIIIAQINFKSLFKKQNKTN